MDALQPHLRSGQGATLPFGLRYQDRDTKNNFPQGLGEHPDCMLEP
jgi:hypothetical protein